MNRQVTITAYSSEYFAEAEAEIIYKPNINFLKDVLVDLFLKLGLTAPIVTTRVKIHNGLFFEDNAFDKPSVTLEFSKFADRYARYGRWINSGLVNEGIIEKDYRVLTNDGYYRFKINTDMSESKALLVGLVALNDLFKVRIYPPFTIEELTKSRMSYIIFGEEQHYINTEDGFVILTLGKEND